MALAFPGSARTALSALGWQAVYRLGCDSALLAMERFFLSPGKSAPLSEDSSFPLDGFPVTAISLGYELDGLLLVQALAAAGIPLLAEKRPAYPLVLGGGPLAFINPAPLSPILDAWFVGEAEAGLAPALEEMARIVLAGTDKQTLLDEMAAWPGFYAPGRSRKPVTRVLVANGRWLSDPVASCFVSPEAEFKDTLLLEVNRGCPHACRFCAAGYVYRPPRQAGVEELKAIVAETGPRKVGLVGTALTDWPDLIPFLEHLLAEKVKFTLSSVRAAGVTPELLHILRNAGLRTLTLALEGPSQRLRDKINKHLGEDEFLRAVELAAARGVNHLKVYVIVGWPGETEADYDEMAWFLDRERGRDEAFPWECVDVGVDRETLWREWELYNAGRQTPGCPAKPCGRCRACEMAAPTPGDEAADIGKKLSTED